jgi:hypothetical protein
MAAICQIVFANVSDCNAFNLRLYSLRLQSLANQLESLTTVGYVQPSANENFFDR